VAFVRKRRSLMDAVNFIITTLFFFVLSAGLLMYLGLVSLRDYLFGGLGFFVCELVAVVVLVKSGVVEK